MSQFKFFRLVSVLILITGLADNYEGLKCHVCHSGMKSCNTSVSPKYFVECTGSALACAIITEDAPLNTEPWFQRICLYPSDLTCFGIDPQDLNDNEGIVKKPSGLTLSEDIDCAKKERQKASLAELPGAPTSFRNKKGFTKPGMGIHTCQGSADGCNSRGQPDLFLYSLGYPAEENDNKMQPLPCFIDDVPFAFVGFQICGPDDNCNDWSDEKLYGMITNPPSRTPPTFSATPSTSNSSTAPVTENSTADEEEVSSSNTSPAPNPPASITPSRKKGSEVTSSEAENRIQVGYDKDEDVIDEGASDDALTNRDGYMRALESKGNEEDEELSYSWSGQKVFQTSEEFSQFIKCLEQVRRKVANVMARSNAVQIPFNETAENEKIPGRRATDEVLLLLSILLMHRLILKTFNCKTLLVFLVLQQVELNFGDGSFLCNQCKHEQCNTPNGNLPVGCSTTCLYIKTETSEIRRCGTMAEVGITGPGADKLSCRETCVTDGTMKLSMVCNCKSNFCNNKDEFLLAQKKYMEEKAVRAAEEKAIEEFWKVLAIGGISCSLVLLLLLIICLYFYMPHGHKELVLGWTIFSACKLIDWAIHRNRI